MELAAKVYENTNATGAETGETASANDDDDAEEATYEEKK